MCIRDRDAAFAQNDAEAALREGIADEGPFFESGGGGEGRHVRRLRKRSRGESKPVSYTHLDVYKRQG